jgi:ribonucleoside-diphosphate reductase alpha chain
VPLRDLVNKFAHVRFEPSGFTGNQEIPIAKSLVDYIFRWLGSRFLSPEEKVSLGLQPAAETGDEPPTSGFGAGAAAFLASAPTPAVASAPEPTPVVTPEPAPSAEPEKPVATAVAPAPAPVHEELAVIATNGHALAAAANGGSAKPANGNGGGGTSTITLNLGATKVSFQTQADAPGCSDCGSIMVRNGSCYKCLNCGSTSGCS